MIIAKGEKIFLIIRYFSVRCQTKCEFFLVEKEEFIKIFEEFPNIEEEMSFLSKSRKENIIKALKMVK